MITVCATGDIDDATTYLNSVDSRKERVLASEVRQVQEMTSGITSWMNEFALRTNEISSKNHEGIICYKLYIDENNLNRIRFKRKSGGIVQYA